MKYLGQSDINRPSVVVVPRPSSSPIVLFSLVSNYVRVSLRKNLHTLPRTIAHLSFRHIPAANMRLPSVGGTCRQISGCRQKTMFGTPTKIVSVWTVVIVLSVLVISGNTGVDAKPPQPKDTSPWLSREALLRIHRGVHSSSSGDHALKRHVALSGGVEESDRRVGRSAQTTAVTGRLFFFKGKHISPPT